VRTFITVILWVDTVREYLRLSADANNTQQLRIKSLFEKRNQKSAQNIMQLQAKVEMFRSQIRELDSVATDTQKKNVGQGFKWAYILFVSYRNDLYSEMCMIQRFQRFAFE